MMKISGLRAFKRSALVAFFATSATAFGGTKAASLSDGQIIGYLLASNQGQIDLSELAAAKAKAAAVKTFAGRMIKVHEDRSVQLLILGQKAGFQPEPSADSETLQATLEADVNALKAIKGGSLDKIFLQQEITHHQKVLSELDQQLAPSAHNSELKTDLSEMRGLIVANLAAAEQIFATL